MKFALPHFLCVGILAQEAESPHRLLERVKRMGLSAKTIDQVEPLLERAIQAFQDNDPRNPELGEAVTRLGMIHQYIAAGDFQAVRSDVEPFYKRALAIYNHAAKQPEPEELALTLELEASALNATGQVEDATLNADRAAVVRKQRVRLMQEGQPQIGAAYKPGREISAPIPIRKTEPEYTNDAKFLKVQGTVVLRLVVDEQGVPRDISLVRSLGFGLDDFRTHALRRGLHLLLGRKRRVLAFGGFCLRNAAVGFGQTIQ